MFTVWDVQKAVFYMKNRNFKKKSIIVFFSKRWKDCIFVVYMFWVAIWDLADFQLLLQTDATCVFHIIFNSDNPYYSRLCSIPPRKCLVLIWIFVSRVKISSGIQKSYLERRAMSATMLKIQFLKSQKMLFYRAIWHKY